MNKQINTGMSFGLTSGVITTLGLMVGLHAGTHSPLAVIGGVVTVAVADALSDALGIHVAEESLGDQTTGQIWQATFATFLAKFFMALSRRAKESEAMARSPRSSKSETAGL